jgi:hypothetical protein
MKVPCGEPPIEGICNKCGACDMVCHAVIEISTEEVPDKESRGLASRKVLLLPLEMLKDGRATIRCCTTREIQYKDSCNY